MTNFIKKIAGGNAKSASNCCGVEIKEVSAEAKDEASAAESNCSTESSSAESSCCSTDSSAKSSSCCG